ncbi:MAG: presenilin family intramembrane aspartyl protease [Candidatus Pacearchaeota archaeon]
MKHSVKITAILISMFIITQLIGLGVIWLYTPVQQQVVINGTIQNITTNPLPYGMEPPQISQDFSLISIVFAFVLAILLVFFLTRLKAAKIIKWWFFIVVVLVLGVTFNAALMHLIPNYSVYNIMSLSELVALLVAIPFAIFKIFKRNFLIHNLTELFVYPGIAVVFIPILNVLTIIILLVIISIYDMWAVWHSGFMQKMAKYQINTLKIFAGFFIPYANKKQRQAIKEARLNPKDKKAGKNIKVNIAILGGGDVVFPIITAGVIFRSLGLIPALIVTLFATLALLALFIFARKGKFYPAMPFLTAGLLIGIGVAYLIF